MATHFPVMAVIPACGSGVFSSRLYLPKFSKLCPSASSRNVSREDIRSIRASVGEGDAVQETSQGGSPSTPVKKTVVRRKTGGKSPDDQISDLEAELGLPSRLVEEEGVSIEGVVKIDSGDGEGAFESIARKTGLALGDVFFLFLFSWIGRATHVSSAVDFELVKTALPFLTGWIAVSLLFGDYSQKPDSVDEARNSALKTWAVGIPLGIALRSIVKAQFPALPFVGVSLASTLVLLVGWRTAIASVLYKNEEEKKKLGGNRRGNPFELLELLTSLVRRW